MPDSPRRFKAHAAFAAVALFGLAACADSPTAPRPALTAADVGTPAATKLPTVAKVRGLRWSKPATSASATRVIGAAGGTITLDGATLVVPPGAVAANTSFRVTRVPGNIVAYEFQPHGVTFRVPVLFAVLTEKADAKALALATRVEAAHFADGAALDQALGTAGVTEFAPAAVTIDKKLVLMAFPHFSGWMVSTGRYDEL
jgi:ethanolamine utilization protein EutA (predicted chaperonin)